MTKEEAMIIRPIRNDDDHARSLRAVDALWGSPIGTPEGDALDVIVQLIRDYEEIHHAIPPPTKEGAIEFLLDQGGLPAEELTDALGGEANVAAILRGEAELTIPMMRFLAQRFGLSVETLLDIAPRSPARAA